MKVRITETINVNVEAWAETFGIEKSEVREDVKSYFGSYCQNQISDLGCEARARREGFIYTPDVAIGVKTTLPAPDSERATVPAPNTEHLPRRWFIEHKGIIWTDRQGRHSHATEGEAQDLISDIYANNAPDRVPDSLDAVEYICWPNFDPINQVEKG